MKENQDGGMLEALPLERPGAGASAARRTAARRWAALAAMLALYFFAFFQRAAVPGTIFNELQNDFRLSASAVTGLAAAFLYVYAAMQLVAGVAADRYGGRRTLLAGGAVMCVGAAALPLAHSPAVLYATRVLIGLGSSFIFLSIVKELDTLFGRRHFAALMGVTVAANSLAGIAATLPFERAVHAWDWRTALGVAALSIAAWGASWWTLRRLPHAPVRHAGLPLHLLRDVFRNRRSRSLLLLSLINFPVLYCIQIILGKKLLEDVAGLSSVSAAGFVLAVAVTSAVAAVSGGAILRLTGQRRKPLLVGTPAIVLVAMLLLLASVLFRWPAWVFLTAYILLGLTTLYFPAASATMKELNRPDAVAISVSVINGIGYAGVAILGNLCGVVLDLFGAAAQAPDGSRIYPPGAYAVLAGFAALTAASLLVAIFWVPETRGRALTLEEIERKTA